LADTTINTTGFHYDLAARPGQPDVWALIAGLNSDTPLIRP
jgi:hypothetical protein